MKRFCAFILLLTLLLAGCSSAPEKEAGPAGTDWGDDLVEIGDRLFIAQVSDIYTNLEAYLGRTVRYEGIFQTGVMPVTGEPFYFVIRNGPGCCGDDGAIGFAVAWPEGWPADVPRPEPDDWVEVVGVFELYDQFGFDQLRVSLLSLTVMEERGVEFVTM